MQGFETVTRHVASWTSAAARLSWPWAVLVLAVVTVPFVVVVASSEQGRPLAVASSITWLHFALLVLATSLAFLLRWRLLDESTSGWLAASLLTIGLSLIPFALDSAAELAIFTPPTAYPQVLCVLLVAAYLRAAARGVDPRGWRHPMLVGGLAGSLLALLPSIPVLDARGGHPVLVGVPLVLATGMVLHHLLQLPDLPRWSIRLMGATLAFALIWHNLAPLDMLDPTLARVVILTCAVGSSVLLLCTSMTLLRQAIAAHDRRLVDLADRLTRAEQGVSHDEELLHELRSTVAGIASASRLLDAGATLPPGERTVGLHRMLASEVTRLERMLRAPGVEIVPKYPESVDLDALLEPLVVALESQGAKVVHRRSGLTVHGLSEEITDVVHALLSNAVRHAPTAQVSVSSELAGSHVVLRIEDNGPGVAPDVRTALFRRDVKGPDSPGQGLGLYIAQRTIRAQGGELWLEDSHQGAVFNLRLPQMSGQ